jgi:hypothetical protein
VTDATQAGSRRIFGRTSRRLASRDVQMRLAVLAIEHWDLLTAGEQERFRTLASDAPRLGHVERRELRALWKRLRIKRLVAEAIAVLTSHQTP